MKDDLLKLIPTYPEAVSDIVLAYHLGLISKPYRWRQIRRGIKKVNKGLSKMSLKEARLLKRTESIQPSTLEYLETNTEIDIEGELNPHLEGFNFSYYSLSGILKSVVRKRNIK